MRACAVWQARRTCFARKRFLKNSIAFSIPVRVKKTRQKIKKEFRFWFRQSEKALGVKHSRKHLSEGLQAREQVERFGQKYK
jgi:hypothetical protein